MVARRGSKHCRRHVSCRLELSLTVRTCLEQGCHRTVRSISIHPRYCSVWYCTYVGGEVRGSGEVKGGGGGGGGRWASGVEGKAEGGAERRYFAVRFGSVNL